MFVFDCGYTSLPIIYRFEQSIQVLSFVKTTIGKLDFNSISKREDEGSRKIKKGVLSNDDDDDEVAVSSVDDEIHAS